MEILHLTKVCILLARGETEDARSALGILERLAELARQTNNPRCLGEILTMQALALEIQGETSAAQASLERAIRQARSGGNLRILVDLGGHMRTMLTNLVLQGRLVPEARPILAAFSREQASGNSVPPTRPGRIPAPSRSHPWRNL
jgi:LuxR family maltose regulon positive regulatory protein